MLAIPMRLTYLLWLLPFSLAAQTPDLRNGAEINEICATCHGSNGQGGKQGEYPRLAGLPSAYIENQMLLFRTRARPNMPMVEHTAENQLNDADVADIAAYLNQINLPSKLPPIDQSRYDPYERLLLAERTLNIPKVAGNLGRGERLSRKDCKTCHGDKGQGKPKQGIPYLTGQYTEYLIRQIDLFRNKDRIHDPDDPDDDSLSAIKGDEWQDIWAYLSVLDD